MMIRHLLSIGYDTLIILSILIFMTFPIVIFVNHGQAISPGNSYYTVFVFGIVFAYLYLFAKRSAPTIGMKAWGLRYRIRGTHFLVFRYLVRLSLFLPLTLRYFYDHYHKEAILEKICGIGVVNIRTQPPE